MSRTVKCASLWDALVLGSILEEQGVRVRRPDEVAPVSMVATGALDGIKAAVAQLSHEFPQSGPVIIEGEDPDDGAPPRPPSAPALAPAPEPSGRPPRAERSHRAPALEPSRRAPAPEPPSAPKLPRRDPARLTPGGTIAPGGSVMDGHERCSDCGQPKVACPYCQGLGRIGAGGFGAPRCRECDGAGVRCPDALSRSSNCGWQRELIRQSELPRQARLASRPSRPRPSPPSRPPAREPSWGTVLATTVRLWAGRRLRPWWQTRWPGVLAALLVAVILISFAITLRLSRGSEGGRAVGRPGGGPALGAAAAARRQAAAWVASQASGDAIVACDPAMCAVLQARGVPASRLLVLTSVRADPLGSDLVVATAAVRSQFGGRLAGVYAPVTLASFGSGTTRIAVQAVAPDGSAAYRTQLARDVRDRQVAGAELLHNHRVHVAGAARAALTGGRVDSRLLATLATLAALHPLEIIGFGGSDPGASAGVPLRSAEIAAAAPPGRRPPASLASLLAFFHAQRPPYLPTSLKTVRITPRRTGLKIEYQVPCPLGLLGTRS